MYLTGAFDFGDLCGVEVIEAARNAGDFDAVDANFAEFGYVLVAEDFVLEYGSGDGEAFSNLCGCPGWVGHFNYLSSGLVENSDTDRWIKWVKRHQSRRFICCTNSFLHLLDFFVSEDIEMGCSFSR